MSAVLVDQLTHRGDIVVLLTVRAGERAPDAITALWKDRWLHRIELAPFDARAVQGNPPAAEESRAAGAYLRWLSRYVAEREVLGEENAHLRQEVRTLQSTATWRLRERLLRVHPLRWAYRWVRGVGR